MTARKSIPGAVVGFTIILLALAAMLAMTWRTWPEPVIDFGRELYVPWQLSQGKMLYRDIAYFNGPLSPYFNSIVFRILGVSLMSLVAVNIAILIGILLMFHRLAAKMSNEIVATTACVAFLILLAIGQPGPVGNYNYLTPYSHEMTHGLALSLGAIVCLVRFVESRKSWWMGTSGALIGLVFLTKPEIFFAAAIAVCIGVILATRGDKRRWIDRAIFAACGLVPLLIALGLLSWRLTTRESIGDLSRAWRFAIDSRITSNAFYQRVRGTFDMEETLQYLLAMTASYMLLFVLPAGIGWFIKSDSTRRIWQFAVSFALVAVALLMFKDFVKWEEAGRAMIFVAIIIAIVTGRSVREPGGILKFVFALFALLMLAKIPLHVQFYHYSFVLAAPTLVLAVVALQCWLPQWINENGGSGAFARGASLAAICVTAGVYIYYEKLVADHKTILVGTGSDAFYALPEGAVVNHIAERLKQTPPDTTVAVVPQGVMINYLARRENPTPFIVQMPPEVIMFTQGRIVTEFQSHPPDLVVYVGANTTEYGFRGYNADFGKPIFDWILDNYKPVEGDPQDPVLKWMIFKRNATPNK